MQLGPGTRIGGRYVIERRLGSGGVGQVWAGRSLANDAPVAIKTLLPVAAVHRELVARFKREAKFLSRIHSQYVARVIDFLSDDEHGLVLVLELVEGEALSDLLASGRLSVERAIDVAWDVLGGVADLHRQQIVHRDLKPGNVIVRPAPGGRTHAVIVDFGMSRFSGVDEHGEEVTALTRADIAVGTIEYMAPEQVLNSRGVTGTADIYAVGAMLYRMVAGRHVFAGIDDRAVFARQKMICDPEPLVTGRSDALARGFEVIVNRMLRRLPAERYQRAEDVLAELAALRSGKLPEPALLSEPAPALRSAPDLSLASEPPLPVSSSPVHPLTVATPAPVVARRDSTAGSGGGRAVGLIAGVLLVSGAAAGVGLMLHRRGAAVEEPSSIVAVDEPPAAAPESAESAAAPAPAPLVAASVDATVPDAEAPRRALVASVPRQEPPKRPARESAPVAKPKPEPSSASAAPLELPSEPVASQPKEPEPAKSAKPAVPQPLDEPE
ncbi:MAG: protein kinase [Myxococcales bacterium]|nr:protein kinase [Myxococcales bacterium]